MRVTLGAWMEKSGIRTAVLSLASTPGLWFEMVGSVSLTLRNVVEGIAR